MKTIKISGPPGTGKTYYLIKQIENACKKYDFNRIGAVSYTKSAVEEIKARVSKNLGYHGKAMSNMKTVHANCFKMLGLGNEQVVEDDGRLVAEWNEAYPLWARPVMGFTPDDIEDPDESRDYRNKERFKQINILRNRMIPIDRWLDNELIDIGKAWMSWMEENEYYDFTRMQEEAWKFKLCPDISVLFVDEAQDLSSLQISLTRLWAEQCDTAIWIGDMDQAIMRFQGAVPEDFRDLEHDWENVLKQSYRVPRAVHAYAMKLIQQINDRRTPVEYLHREEEGQMTYSHGFPDFSAPGTHMIICRTQKMVARWIKWLVYNEIPFTNPYRPDKAWNPTKTKLWEAVTSYDRLSRGMEINREEMTELLSSIKVKGNLIPGIKSHRKSLLDNAGLSMFNVFDLNALGWFEPDFFNFDQYLGHVFSLDGQAGKILDKVGREIVREEPRIFVGTIHSVKGGEADHVWVDTSSIPVIEKASHESLQAFDDEVRLYYVAVTRAKQSCHLLNPNGLRSHAVI